MKEATGELNMTVITLVAITAIAAVFYFVVYPIVQRALVTQTCRSAYGSNWTARSVDVAPGGQGQGQGSGAPTGCIAADDNQSTDSGNTSTTIKVWFCCPENTQNP